MALLLEALSTNMPLPMTCDASSKKSADSREAPLLLSLRQIREE